MLTLDEAYRRLMARARPTETETAERHKALGFDMSFLFQLV